MRIQTGAYARWMQDVAAQLADNPQLRRALRRPLARPRREHPWQAHPAVRKGRELSAGERAADQLKRVFATWTALIVVLVVIMWWLYAGGFPPGSDSPGFLHLNLSLSCFAALQCFILLIAAKRADQIAAEIAVDTLRNTQETKADLAHNTDVTERTYALVLSLANQQNAGAQPAQDTETIPPCQSSPALQSKR